MIITYDSMTGNVERFVQKLGFECIRVQENLILDKPYVLITYTTGFGQVPAKVLAFLNNNRSGLYGVAASGNRNWGDNFARSADLIAEQHQVPVISKFELCGTERDVEQFKKGVLLLASHRTQQRAYAAG
jgi:protein involved in ribonucleotide reduction